MSERFTKGPWTANYEDRVPMCMTIRGGKNNIPIAYISAFVPTDVGEDYADGKLIAAAPEMYDMLKELYDNLNRGVKYIISRRVKNGCPIDLARKCSASNIELARRIKALLKKARGEKCSTAT